MTLQNSESVDAEAPALSDLSGPNTMADLEARIRWFRAHPGDVNTSITPSEVANRLSRHLHEPWPPTTKAFVCDLLAGRFSAPTVKP